MQLPKRIMVVISGIRKQHYALERALKFAQFNEVHIYLFNSIYEPVMELSDVLSSNHRKEMKRQYLADRHLYMDSIADELNEIYIKCSVHISWHRDLHEAIEDAVVELKPDLVIKRISADADSINPFTMPVDRHLLRYCPAPLLLVNSPEWSAGPVLAAIDPMTFDKKHIAFNDKILEHTEMLAYLTESVVHTVNTFEMPSRSLAIDLPVYDFEVIRKSNFIAHEEKMLSVIKKHQIDPANVHVIEGVPGAIISEFAQTLKAQIVVLGTVGRSGLAAFFIGNTAERVLAELSCEVLALKPD